MVPGGRNWTKRLPVPLHGWPLRRNGVEYKIAGTRPSWTIRRRKNFSLADDSSDVVSATPK